MVLAPIVGVLEIVRRREIVALRAAMLRVVRAVRAAVRVSAPHVRLHLIRAKIARSLYDRAIFLFGGFVDIEIVINRSGIYGGVKRLYAVAEYLVVAGHNVVVNSEDGKGNNWFQHSIQENIAIKPQIRICAETCRRLLPGAINILYQQAQFDAPEPDEQFNLVVTTTKYLSDFLLTNSGITPDYLVPYGFDSDLFHPGSIAPESNVIAYMPRKNKEEAELILQLMQSVDVKFVPIDGLSEAKVIRELQKANIFLALSREEGFGMPSFESSLCGCIIVGYHGRGGKEWLTDKTCVLTKSPQEFPVCIEETIRGQHEAKRLALRQLIKEHLTVEKERNAWLTVINHAIKLYSRKFVRRDP